MTNQTKLVCLKCGGDMRTYERNGITIDQCERCHGIFLDQGELERLISAESAYLSDYGREGQRDDHHGSGGHHDSGRSGKGRKKGRGGFLGELFD